MQQRQFLAAVTPPDYRDILGRRNVVARLQIELAIDGKILSYCFCR